MGNDTIDFDNFHAEKVDKSAVPKDAELAKKLWDVSEELTAVSYNWAQNTTEEILL